jgi:hypothetical protein
LWKSELAAFAAEARLTVTSKWNKIEHRLFSHTTLNWRRRPLTGHEVVLNTIAATTTRTGLKRWSNRWKRRTQRLRSAGTGKRLSVALVLRYRAPVEVKDEGGASRLRIRSAFRKRHTLYSRSRLFAAFSSSSARRR